MTDELDRSSFEGVWWVPGSDNIRVAGTLQLGQIFELHTVGAFSSDGLPTNALTTDILNGAVPRRMITLLGCVQQKSALFGKDLVMLSVRFDKALLGGYLLDNSSDAVFDEVFVELDAVSEWASYQPISSSDVGEKIVVEYEKPAALSANLSSGQVRMVSDIRGSDDEQKVNWKAVSSFIVTLDRPLSIDDIEERYVRPLRYLLSLATGTPAVVTRLRVQNSAHTKPLGASQWLDVEFYQGKLPPEPPKPVSRHDMLFKLDDIEFSQFLPRWFELVERCGISLDLLFSLDNPGNIFVTNRMFNAVTAVEGLHQRLNPIHEDVIKVHKKRVDAIAGTIDDKHERKWLRENLAGAYRPTLRTRLGELLDLAGSTMHPYVGDRERWIKRVKDIRDLIGHGSSELEKDRRVQIRLTASLELLYKLILMRELGFSDQYCMRAFTANRRWSYLPIILRSEIPEIFDIAHD
jgi:hypothetical protein